MTALPAGVTAHAEPGMGLVEVFPVSTDQDDLRHLLEVVFEHWRDIRFGPIVQGAAYEIAAPGPARIGVLDGYATIDFGAWHLHLCIGPTVGDPDHPTEPEIAAIRPCHRAELYRSFRDGAPVSWGLRLFNGRDEQLITVLLPNPFLDDAGRPCEPDWTRLTLWDRLREEFCKLQPDAVDRLGRRFVHG